MKRIVSLLALVAIWAIALVSASAQQPTASFSEPEFARLKWLEGQWKGSGGTKPFYEAYRMTSKTMLEITHFSDDSFTTPTGKGSVYLERGRILHDSGNAQWAAVRLTPTSIEFEPVRNASNAFGWTRKSPDAWTAVLKPKGRPETTYQMTRVIK